MQRYYADRLFRRAAQILIFSERFLCQSDSGGHPDGDRAGAGDERKDVHGGNGSVGVFAARCISAYEHSHASWYAGRHDRTVRRFYFRSRENKFCASCHIWDHEDHRQCGRRLPSWCL